MIGYRVIRLGTKKLRVYSIADYNYRYYVEECKEIHLVKNFDSDLYTSEELKVMFTGDFSKYVKHLREIRE